MKQQLTTWIDNTGLHSAGRALEGRGSRLDADGLLQLATLAVFSDEITLGSFEAREVFDRSTDVRANLVERGLPCDSLRISDVNEGMYKTCCQRAAQIAAAELEEFSSGQRELRVESSPEVAPYARRKNADLLSRITLPLSNAQRNELAAEALSNKAAGAVEYMLLSCPELWERAGRREVESRASGSTQEGSLGLRLRYYLNHELANEHSATYAPARARAMHVREAVASILVSLDKMVTDAARELRERSGLEPVPTGVPRVSLAIVALAKGEPASIPKVVSELREKASGLRAYLLPRFARVDPVTGAGMFELCEALRTVRGHLERCLGREATRVDSRDGLELQVNPFAPWADLIRGGAKISARTFGQIPAWLNARWNARRITALVNLSEAAAFGNHASAMKKFYKACTRRAAGRSSPNFPVKS